MYLGIATPDKFGPNSPDNRGRSEYAVASVTWPNVTDLGALWHLMFLKTDPVGFWKGYRGHHSEALANNPQEQANYTAAIKNTINQGFDVPALIATIAKSGMDLGNYVISHVYPEHNEWWQSYLIKSNLPGWMKAHIAIDKTFDEARQATHAAEVKRLLQEWGPEDWANQVDKELAAAFYGQFFAKEIEEIQAAKAMEVSERNKKFMLLAVGGGVAIFALQAMFKKKR